MNYEDLFILTLLTTVNKLLIPYQRGYKTLNALEKLVPSLICFTHVLQCVMWVYTQYNASMWAAEEV